MEGRFGKAFNTVFKSFNTKYKRIRVHTYVGVLWMKYYMENKNARYIIFYFLLQNSIRPSTSAFTCTHGMHSRDWVLYIYTDIVVIYRCYVSIVFLSPADRGLLLIEYLQKQRVWELLVRINIFIDYIFC